jgi:phosphoglycolate phosphatase
LIAEASVLDAAGPILPREVVMIGDSDVDILTARNCGARSVGCTYGLAPERLAAAEPDAVAHAPTEWLAAIRGL